MVVIAQLGSDGSTDDCPCYVVSKYAEGTDLAKKVKEKRLKYRDAAELVAVDYTPEIAVIDMRAALQPGAPVVYPDDAPDNIAFEWVDGDEAATKAAFDGADRVISLELVNNRLIVNPMEPRAALGDVRDGRLTLVTGTPPSARARAVPPVERIKVA